LWKGSNSTFVGVCKFVGLVIINDVSWWVASMVCEYFGLQPPKCSRPILSFLECALNWTKKRQHFDKFYQFFRIVTMQIQNRHVKDHMSKKTQQYQLWIERL